MTKVYMILFSGVAIQDSETDEALLFRSERAAKRYAERTAADEGDDLDDYEVTEVALHDGMGEPVEDEAEDSQEDADDNDEDEEEPEDDDEDLEEAKEQLEGLRERLDDVEGNLKEAQDHFERVADYLSGLE